MTNPLRYQSADHTSSVSITAAKTTQTLSPVDLTPIPIKKIIPIPNIFVTLIVSAILSTTTAWV
jgi:hypothetical protein